METNIKTATVPPTYKQLLEEMGKQLSQRKSALLKRVLLITWPFILLIVAIYALEEIYDFKNFSDEQAFWAMSSFVVYLFLALVYSAIVKFIFEIEKRIWIDSYFDHKNLSLSQSWRIAKKLFWKAFVFRFKVYLQYYLIPIITTIALSVAVIYISTLLFPTTEGQINIIIASFFVLILFFIMLWIYSYYLKIKLRYAWFIFLDKFGPTYSYKSIIDEMDILNKISKSETFKKSLILNIGTDSINILALSTIGIISHGMSNFGNTGRMFGSILRIYGEEASRQAADLGNISAHYILYRFARKEAHGNEQEVNDYLYSLPDAPL